MTTPLLPVPVSVEVQKTGDYQIGSLTQWCLENLDKVDPDPLPASRQPPKPLPLPLPNESKPLKRPLPQELELDIWIPPSPESPEKVDAGTQTDSETRLRTQMECAVMILQSIVSMLGPHPHQRVNWAFQAKLLCQSIQATLEPPLPSIPQPPQQEDRPDTSPCRICRKPLRACYSEFGRVPYYQCCGVVFYPPRKRQRVQ